MTAPLHRNFGVSITPEPSIPPRSAAYLSPAYVPINYGDMTICDAYEHQQRRFRRRNLMLFALALLAIGAAALAPTFKAYLDHRAACELPVTSETNC